MPNRPTELDPDATVTLARAVIETERQAVDALLRRVDDQFIAACRLMLRCSGRIVVIGMGKSGHIASKIAATLASTGTPAFFVHPGEASHGDLGMITGDDVALALSNSGETQELLTILPVIKRLDVPLISLTGNPRSTLARNATVHVDVSVEKEACPLGLAPTSSTTAALVMGDALAISLLHARGFTEEDFARSHPGGALGRRLLVRISDIMHQGDEIPRVEPDMRMPEVIEEMSSKGFGMTAVSDPDGRLLGVFTDGDLRRAWDVGGDMREVTVSQVMTREGITIHPERLAVEAAAVMQRHKINALLVVSRDDQLVGALNFHDLLRAGIV
ncbi:MAG: KpsF/GutQ family sugar-phosphate isomerase [Pseudomonadota bacterium]